MPIAASPSAAAFFSNFVGVPIFLVMWAGYKVIYRTKWLKLVREALLSTRDVPC